MKCNRFAKHFEFMYAGVIWDCQFPITAPSVRSGCHRPWCGCSSPRPSGGRSTDSRRFHRLMSRKRSASLTSDCTVPRYPFRDSPYVVIIVRCEARRVFVADMNTAIFLYRRSLYSFDIRYGFCVNFISHTFTTLSALSISRSICAPPGQSASGA